MSVYSSTGPHPPWQTMMASIEAVEFLKLTELIERQCAEAKHGHEFGCDRICQCGVTELDYYSSRHRKVCAVWMEKHRGQRA